MIEPKTRMRDMRMEDNPDPLQPSSHYVRHWKFFGIDPKGKTITKLVLELKTTAAEIFIRNCHLEPDTYDFSEFRLTRTHKLQRELSNYLVRLSSWLYRGTEFPPALKRALRKSNAYKNPYDDFAMEIFPIREIPTLNNLMLTVAYNRSLSVNNANVELKELIKELIIEEFQKRKIDISVMKHQENENLQKIQLLQTNAKKRIDFLPEVTTKTS